MTSLPPRTCTVWPLNFCMIHEVRVCYCPHSPAHSKSMIYTALAATRTFNHVSHHEQIQLHAKHAQPPSQAQHVQACLPFHPGHTINKFLYPLQQVITLCMWHNCCCAFSHGLRGAIRLCNSILREQVYDIVALPCYRHCIATMCFQLWPGCSRTFQTQLFELLHALTLGTMECMLRVYVVEGQLPQF